MLFRDRSEAGRRLAFRLQHLRERDPIILALPRGGVVVGVEVARLLDAPLDVILARKLGAPGNPELALGAVAEGGTPVVDWKLARALGATEDYVRRVASRENAEIARYVENYRGGRPLPSLEGRVCILIDDGMATGYTMLAALRTVRSRGPSHCVVAAPVAPQSAPGQFKGEADEVILLATPEPFFAVGQFYMDFPQVSDGEVMKLLRELAPRTEGSGTDCE